MRVSPFVVIPGEDFDEGAFHDHGRESIDDRRVGVAPEVHGHERKFTDFQDPLHSMSRSFFESIIHLLNRGRLFQLNDEVRYRNHGSGHAQRDTGQFTLKSG